jgi:hypothetical protein
VAHEPGARSLDDLHALHAARRERHRRHREVVGEQCRCEQCRAADPVPLAGPLGEILGALGLDGERRVE